MNRKADKEHKKTSLTLSRFLGRSVDIASGLGDDQTMPPSRATRVLGPYYDEKRALYRLHVFEGDRRTSVSRRDEAEALRLKAQIEQVLSEQRSLTVGEAVDSFIEAKRQQGLEQGSLTLMDYRLKHFLPLEESLGAMTPQRAQALYVTETQRVSRYGRPVRAQTHQSILRLTKLMFRWLVEAGHLPSNPFEKVKPVGKANVGKAQFRIDEARRFFAVTEAAAREGHEGATALLLQLFLGLRSNEVLRRPVRDLDDGARVVWIPKGKTKNARRRLEVPELLRPFLLRLVQGKAPDSLIFSNRAKPHYHAWLWKQLQKFCELANVPKVCPHSLRGLHSSLAISAGSTHAAVASALGHGSFAITAKHYVNPDTLANTAVTRVVGALAHDTAESQPDPLERLRSLAPEKLAALLALVDGAKV